MLCSIVRVLTNMLIAFKPVSYPLLRKKAPWRVTTQSLFRQCPELGFWRKLNLNTGSLQRPAALTCSKFPSRQRIELTFGHFQVSCRRVFLPVKGPFEILTDYQPRPELVTDQHFDACGASVGKKALAALALPATALPNTSRRSTQYRCSGIGPGLSAVSAV